MTSSKKIESEAGRSGGLVELRSEPATSLGHSATIPSADKEADDAVKFGALLSQIRSAEWACSEIVCVYPHDGNCWCFNTALAEHIAQAIETRRAETSGSVADESAVAKPCAQVLS